MRPKSWTENKLLEVHFYGKESLIVFQTNPSLRKTKTESLPRRKQLSVFICFLAARRQGQCRALRLVRENLTWWTRGELLSPAGSVRVGSDIHRMSFTTDPFNSLLLSDRQNLEKPPQGWLFQVLVDPRGVEPLSENPLGRLSSWAVCYEVLPGGAQTDTRHRDGSPFLDDRLKDETPMHLPC